MLTLLFLLALQSDAIVPGRILDRVACNASQDQTYSLYLPSAYDPGRAWPVIFAFDDGTIMLLNGFIKKSRKTPPAEIDLALKRFKEMTS